MDIVPKDLFEMVKARIISSDERQVTDVLWEARGVALMEAME